MRWLVAVEDDPARGHLLRGGSPLLQAGVQDGLIAAGGEDGLALAILSLHERRMVTIDYHLLEVDQGPQMFRGQPSYHLQQIMGLDTTSVGRDWVRDSQPTSNTFNITNSPIGQLAGRDIHNTLTLISLIDALERGVDEAEATEEAKQEAKGVLRGLRRAARAGGEAVQQAGTDVLAKVLAQTLGIPPE